MDYASFHAYLYPLIPCRVTLELEITVPQTKHIFQKICHIKLGRQSI